MRTGVWWRLAGMMALIYAVQGAWYPLLAVHLQDLGLSGRARGWIFATYALASIASPLGVGQLADRRIATQRLLALIYALAAALLALLAAGRTARADVLFGVFLTYWLVTAPAYGLSNTVAFRNLPRSAEQFGPVRLWGTIGWMLIGYPVSGAVAWTGLGTGAGFAVGAVVALGFAAYCLAVLPETPPLATGGRRPGEWLDALVVLRRPAVATFLAIAFAVSVTFPFVYQTVPPYLQAVGLPRTWIPTAMTLAQIPEILTLAALPRLHRRFGFRGTIALGLASWVLMYLLLAARPPLAVALAAVALNGVSVGGFVISAQMYLDTQAPADRRAGVQGLYLVTCSGLGALLGNLLAGELVARAGAAGRAVFLVPGLIVLAALAAIGGRRSATGVDTAPAAIGPHDDRRVLLTDP